MEAIDDVIPTIASDAVDGVELPPSRGELLALYRGMVRLRTYDERSVVYHRQGRIGTYPIFWGHEAVQVGALHALTSQDWLFPSYRECAIGLLRGMPATMAFLWWRGHPEGWWDPREWRIASISVPVGSHVPHAAGMAWGLKLRGEEAVTLAFFGDGATSEGAFHEGLTFASAMQLPVVFLCNNNSWAISTPVAAQCAAERLVDKAVGYGMPGVRVDGGDVLAVHAAVRAAARRARSGGGPSFIEAVTYRMAPHATADDPSIYIDAERIASERQHECVGRLESDLLESEVLSEDAATAIREEAVSEMRAGFAQAESLPPPDPRLVFDTTYVNPPASVSRARMALLGG
jgi:pyruvate dehydrogenase E1 component alpha subunit